VITFLAFSIVNVFLPYTRVHLRPALLGAGVSSVLWEVGKKGFYQYVKHVPAYSKFYGSLGVIPVFLLWVYLTWRIVLLGVVITRTAQNLQQFLKAQKEGEATPPTPPSPVLAVYFLDRVYCAFDAGGPLPGIEEVAERLGVGTQVLEPIARSLVEKGLLIEDKERPGTYAPARASGRVRIHEVLEIVPGGFLRLEEFGQSAGSDPSGRRVLQIFQDAKEAFLRPLRQRTFGDTCLNAEDRNN